LFSGFCSPTLVRAAMLHMQRLTLLAQCRSNGYTYRDANTYAKRQVVEQQTERNTKCNADPDPGTEKTPRLVI